MGAVLPGATARRVAVHSGTGEGTLSKEPPLQKQLAPTAPTAANRGGDVTTRGGEASTRGGKETSIRGGERTLRGGDVTTRGGEASTRGGEETSIRGGERTLLVGAADEVAVVGSHMKVVGSPGGLAGS